MLRPDDASASTGHIPCTLSIEGKGVVNAYQINTEEFLNEKSTALFGAEIVFAAEAKPTDFYLLYCLNQDGDSSWYQYDSVEGTFQRYSAALYNTATNAKQDEEMNNIMTELAQAKQMLMIGAIVAVVLLVILLIIIVVLSVKLRKSGDEFYEDDEVQIEFYEMPEVSVEEPEIAEENEDEIEIEFYEMPSELKIPDMEDLLVKEAMAEQPASQTVKTVEQSVPQMREAVEQPKRVVTPIDVDDDSDLEFIDLD